MKQLNFANETTVKCYYIGESRIFNGRKLLLLYRGILFGELKRQDSRRAFSSRNHVNCTCN